MKLNESPNKDIRRTKSLFTNTILAADSEISSQRTYALREEFISSDKEEDLKLKLVASGIKSPDLERKSVHKTPNQEPKDKLYSQSMIVDDVEPKPTIDMEFLRQNTTIYEEDNETSKLDDIFK